MKKLRPVGDILLDIEKLREELIDDHGFQWGDIFHETHGWLVIHRPEAQEEYVEGKYKHPEFYYGYPRGKKK